MAEGKSLHDFLYNKKFNGMIYILFNKPVIIFTITEKHIVARKCDKILNKGVLTSNSYTPPPPLSEVQEGI